MAVFPITGTVELTTARLMAAAALEPVTAADPFVHPTRVDAGDPPALVLDWGQPMLEVDRARHYGRVAVWCIAPWNDLGVLEGLVSYVIRRMAADHYAWGMASASAPVDARWGDVPCTAASVDYRVPVIPNTEGA